MAFDAYLNEHEERHLHDLNRLLEIPSISALSEHKEDVARAARWLCEYLESIGMEEAAVLPTAKHPVVCAEWLHRPGAPTVLIYGHYDVQPVDPIALWTSPPFAPAVRDGKLYARGSADDKGQVMVNLQALEALLQSEGGLPVNVKVLIEGEEEIGSPSLEPFINEHRGRVEADVVLISDTSMLADGLPTICCGLRGLCGLEVHVTTAATDLHSGIYGGAVANPTHVLASLLASMREGQGRILVPGFYDDVLEPSAQERAQIAALPGDEESLRRRLGVPALDGEPGYSAMERTSIRPTLEVNGMWGGFQGEGTKTVIPNEAHAKITCRLVPNQDPAVIAKAVAKHLHDACPPSARVEVEIGHSAYPWRCDPASTPIRAAIRSLESAFGTTPALARLGGSIPVVESFDRLLQVPCVLMGFAAPDANAHAPDESFPIETWRTARFASARFLHELAKGD